jgi:signal transduction histidine kinase
MRKPGQTIELSCNGISCEVFLDKKILRNIVLNLLSNAIKYSEKNISLRAEVNAENIVLYVRDQGIGIPAEQQKNMFGKFFRASNASEIQGTGLGLNIVKHYVDLINGRIEFTSEEGIGTTFKLTIPKMNEEVLIHER